MKYARIVCNATAFWRGDIRQLSAMWKNGDWKECYLTFFCISCTVELFKSFTNRGSAERVATSPAFTAFMNVGSSMSFLNSGSSLRDSIKLMTSLSFCIFCWRDCTSPAVLLFVDALVLLENCFSWMERTFDSSNLIMPRISDLTM